MPPHRITDPKEIENYFWKRVLKTETCWLWTGTIHRGYGIIGLRVIRTKRMAHRYSYELHYGPLSEGMEACHKCDNPTCVRPDHLFEGTQSDNMKDAGRKGRIRKGIQHHNAKLTLKDIPEILRLRSQGLSYLAISKHFNVDQRTIGHVCRGTSWKSG